MLYPFELRALYLHSLFYPQLGVIPNPGFQHRAGQEPEKYRKAARTSSRKIKSDGGRYRIRTYDFHRVKMALYR
jgi:hypothetical protein